MNPLQQFGQGVLKLVKEARQHASHLKTPERIVREFRMDSACLPGPWRDATSLIPGYPRVRVTVEFLPNAVAEQENEAFARACEEREREEMEGSRW